MSTTPRLPHSSFRLSSLLTYLGVLTLTLCALTSVFGAPAAHAQLSETSTPAPEFSATPTFTYTPTLDPGPIDQLPTATPIFSEPTVEPEVPTPAPTPEEIPTETPLPEVWPTDIPPAPLVELSGDFVPGQLIVKLVGDASADAVNALANQFDLYVRRYLPGVDAWLVSGAPDRLAATIGLLREAPDVAYVELNYRTHVLADPTDPLWLDQTSLQDLQITQAWDITTGSPDVIVAVIDSGLDVTHPDLAGQMWINAGEDGLDDSGADKRTNEVDDDDNGYVDDWAGWNFKAASADMTDDNGHGTHLAGLIAAAANNGEGISGIAPGVRVMTLKATDDTGVGSYAEMIEALVYAAERGVRVINLSLGGDSPSQALQAAVKYTLRHNAVVIAASTGTQYPAAYEDVIAVGNTATDDAATRAEARGFSRIDLLAPGQSIVSTWPGGYHELSGASTSAAQVSGIAALLASVPKFETAASIREALLATALRGGAYGVSDGALEQTLQPGLVQAYAALNYGEPLAPTAPEAVNMIWGQTSTAATGCTIGGTAANAYTPASFDGLTATCTFTGAGTWTYNNLQDPLASLTSIDGAAVTVRLAVTNWVDDQIVIEASNNGTTWTPLATLAAGNPPTSTLSFYTYNASAVYSTRALLVAAQLRFNVIPVGGLDAGLTLASDQVRITALNAFAPIPTPTAPAPQPTVIPRSSDPHVDYAANTDKCAACHRTHTAAGQGLRQAAPEENVCFLCHRVNATPITATNVYSAFTAYTNTATAFYKHDVFATNGIHQPGGGDSYGGANRHVECEDCHEPHEATRGSAAPPMIQRVMSGTTGILPVYTSGSALPTFNFLPQAQREHQVCLKCHSNFTTAPTYVPDGWNTALVANGLKKLTSANALQVLDSRNMAAEFNPYAGSFHPVLAQGRNQAMSAASFVAGWSQTSLVYCSDCHQNNAAPTQGAHSSPLLHLLAGTTNYKTGDNSTPLASEVCFKCHSFAVYVTGGTGTTGAGGTNFYFQTNRNLHSFHVRSSVQTSCYTCHDSHGSEQPHLMNFDLSVVTPNAGYNSQTAYVSPTGAGTGRCYIGCHGHNHSGDTYP